MAGRARRQALSDQLDTLTRDYFDVDPTDVAIGSATIPTHLEYVCARVESGTTTKQLCRELSDSLGYDLTYERLMRYLRESWPNETQPALDEARSRASHCMAEDALELVDAPAYDSVSVQQARNRANQRNWMAERYNPSQYGQSKGINVAISVTQLHLSALQHPSNTVTGSLAQPAHNTSLSGAEQAQVVAVTPVSPSQG